MLFMEQEKRLYSVQDVAKITGYTKQWVCYLIKTGRVKATMIGGTYVIERDEALKYVGKKKGHLNSVFPRKYMDR